MDTEPMHFRFWQRWLLAAAAGVCLFGLTMVFAPGLTQRLFGLMLYASPTRVAGFGADAVAYIALAHAVLGAVMYGWGMAMILVILGPFRRGAKEGWQILGVSITAWCLPDTAFSLWSGFWQNAVLNLALVIVFAIPLTATYRHFHQGRGAAPSSP